MIRYCSDPAVPQPPSLTLCLRVQPPQRDNRPVVAVYFILVQLVCAFLMMNVFVGVVVDKFTEQKTLETEGAALMTDVCCVPSACAGAVHC